MKHDKLTVTTEPALKNELERVCSKIGMNISAAFAVFARKLIREQTADISVDDIFTRRQTLRIWRRLLLR